MAFRKGQRVRVKPDTEILATLDDGGCFEGLPFMPEMLEYCGKEFTVSSSAHKTCDTVNQTGGRWLPRTVHLAGLRCDGAAHGGCEADCLIFWKEAWLEPADQRQSTSSTGNPIGDNSTQDTLQILSPTRREDSNRYRCQATELPKYTTLAKWWDPRQYLLDITTGNVKIARLVADGLSRTLEAIIESGRAYGIATSMYDRLARHRGGISHRYFKGPIPRGKPTPTEKLNLQPGEWVQIKSFDEILPTLNEAKMNRGMRFDPEMVPYCGGTYRVKSRVNRIIDERTGEMREMKTPCIILEGVVCRSRFSDRRMFCPRAIPSYWRENWLKRVEPSSTADATKDNQRRVPTRSL